MSKGSKQRPTDIKSFGANYDLIFGKSKMTPRVEDMKNGTCGCGRSPTGNCIGWHALSEEAFRHQQMLWMEEELRRDNEVDSLK
jgi:hypothetical protein